MGRKRIFKTSDHQRTGKPGISPFYIKKAEAYSKSWVGEWTLIQKRRKSGDPLMQGGRNKTRIFDVF